MSTTPANTPPDDRLYLVTGANGYIGGQIAEYLLERGRKVRILVRSPEKGEALRKKGAEVAIGDLQKAETIAAAVKGVYGIYHIGAVYREAGLPDETYFDVNAEGTRRVFEAAIAAGVPRIVHCSTGGVLGHIANPPGSDKTPYAPGDVYQRSKTEAEKIALEYYRSKKVGGVVIRPAMVFGPGDTRHLKMFRMIAKQRFFYVGRGDAFVHFIDIRDLVRAFVLGMEHEERNGEVYCIPGREVRKLHEAVSIIARQLGVSEPWLRLPVKPMQWLGSACEAICKPFGIQPPIFRRRVDFYTKSRYFDGSKAERELGFVPAKTFAEEVADTISWYRNHKWI